MTIKHGFLAGAAAVALCAGAVSADTIKIGYIEGMSGPFANAGDAGMKHFTFAIDQLNEAGGGAGMDYELLVYDSKTNPKEALVQLQKAIDDGVRIITQGNGSSIASALIDAVDKHNKRNPGDEILFINYAAVDPSFTNDRCSYWHFRFDADADMKMEAMTDWLAAQEDITKVYLIGQDYSFGRAVAAAARSMLEEKRPDIEIVGDELHPLGKVKDFTPYVQKISSAGAQAVITGNWGQDMALLIKAASDAGQDMPYLTYYGGGLGAPTAMGESAVGLVKQVTEYHENVESSADQIALMDAFEQKFDGLDLYYFRILNAMEMLDTAIDTAGSADPVSIAPELEGMVYEGPWGSVTMRADNHQALQTLYISTFADDVARGVEGMPMGFRTDENGVIAAENTATETTCQMERPE